MENTKKIYGSDLPYPEVKVLGPNPYYANLLKEDYTGIVSEMTAITQYLYHYFDVKNLDEELGYLLEEISIVEMHHLEILAQLITLLGEKPIYYAENNFWNASYVYYGDNIYAQLQSDIEGEYKAIELYQYHIQLIKDPYIQAVLQRIILDEEVHIKLLTSALQKLY